MLKTDTIAAIATAMSESGIGIVRVSGEDTQKIVDKLYRNKYGNKCLLNFKSHTIRYGYIVDDSDAVVDEVMVAFMKAPNTYTREDIVEINCHGGVLMMDRILKLVLQAGARLAQPGEFTKRAFLNGRLDLSRAEAVMDLIHSKNQYALKNSLRQLRGDVSKAIKDIREEILYEIAFIESALDDPEHISLDGYADKLKIKNKAIIEKITKLIDSADSGRMVKDGIRTVIVGKPNAGKSSLLNLLAGEERAIVTDVAGTTRDILEEHINLHGIQLNVIDTAGIRNTEDVVEKIGVEKARKYALDADLIIYVVDSSVSLDENDRDIIQMIGSRKCIVLFNKTDLEQKVSEETLYDAFGFAETYKSDISVVRTSMKDQVGMDQLECVVKEMFFAGDFSEREEVCITNLRHKEALTDARESLLQVEKSLEDEMPEDFYSIDLMSAYAALGSIIGEEVDEDLVNEIFSKFCMGK